MDFSLIIPCYNEAENVRAFLSAALSCFGQEDLSCELIFVDDGSTDGTSQAIHEAISSWRKSGFGDSALGSPSRCAGPAHLGGETMPSGAVRARISFRVVEFARNFGKEAAMFAGLEQSSGDYVGFIDADLQQDPTVSLKMLRILQAQPDYDCVAAVQEQRHESLPMRACKHVFYRAFNRMCNLDVVEGASDFRVFSRPVAEALLSMREQFRFSKGLFSWIGFKTKVITYQVHDRYKGQSKWTLRSLASYAWNGIVAFSTWPLRAVMVLGVLLALVTFGLFAFDIACKLLFNDDLPANQVLLYVVLLLGGIQMFVLGVFGEYLARAYIESKHRPLYVARRMYAYEAAPRVAEDAAAARGEQVRAMAPLSCCGDSWELNAEEEPAAACASVPFVPPASPAVSWGADAYGAQNTSAGRKVLERTFGFSAPDGARCLAHEAGVR